MARKDEVRTSENIVKYMKFINSYEEGKYTAYEFLDESGNVGIHYQIRPELLTDKKQIALARLFNTKVSKLNIGDIAVVICKAREMHEEKYSQSAFYLNVEKILKPLSKYKTVTKYYNGVLMDFAEEEHVTSWEDVRR